MSKKIIQKKASKQAEEKPDAPVTRIIDINGGNAIRVFDLGPLFGFEKRVGTVDLVAKDGVSHFCRRTGHDIAYSPQGFDLAPPDSAAYVTIEEVEAECYEISEADRDRAKEALNEDQHKLESGSVPDGHQVGVLSPPTPREEAKEPDSKEKSKK